MPEGGWQSMKLENISEEVAKEFIGSVLDSLDGLCFSVSFVKNNSDQEGFEDYRRKVAQVVSGVSDFALEPVFAIYPNLREWSCQRHEG